MSSLYANLDKTARATVSEANDIVYIGIGNIRLAVTVDQADQLGAQIGHWQATRSHWSPHGQLANHDADPRR